MIDFLCSLESKMPFEYINILLYYGCKGTEIYTLFITWKITSSCLEYKCIRHIKFKPLFKSSKVNPIHIFDFLSAVSLLFLGIIGNFAALINIYWHAKSTLLSSNVALNALYQNLTKANVVHLPGLIIQRNNCEYVATPFR